MFEHHSTKNVEQANPIEVIEMGDRFVKEESTFKAMRALNRHVEREFNTDWKDTHWGRRKLARDQ